MRLVLSTITLLLASVILSGAEPAPQDTSKSLLFRMFKPQKEQGVEYEKGYFFDRIFRRREFHNPVRIIPVELRYGFGYNGGSGFLWLKTPTNWLGLDGEGVESFDGGSLGSRIGHQIDVDLLKTNLPFYILKTSWLDMHTGINLRYASLFLPVDVPKEWSGTNQTWLKGVKFTGELLEISWSQSLILQWYESWYINMRYTYGFASSNFYGKNSISGWGPSQSFALGGRLILDPGETNRYTIGLDLKYTNTVINHISDPNDISPITQFTLNNIGVFTTISVFFGGRKSEGDVGKMHYYRKDYITATRLLESFVDKEPTHANRHRAEKLIVKSKQKIPWQLMREGMSFDERGMVDKALQRYIRARSLADTILVPVLDERIREMAFMELEKAESLLENGRGEEAIKKVKSIGSWHKEMNNHILRFETTHLLNEGKRALEHGFHRKALELFDLAVEKDSRLKPEVGAYRAQIAGDLLAIADSVEDIASIRLVVYSLEESRRLIGDIGRGNERILDALKAKLARREEFLIRQRIDQRMEAERIKDKILPQIKLGMLISKVQDIMGEPSEKISQGQDQKNQLWIYNYKDGAEVLLTFVDYVLFRIEVK